MSRGRLGFVALLFLGAAPAHVHAQGLVVTGSAGVDHLRSTVVLQGVHESTAGVWAGGSLDLRVSRFALSVLVARGTLSSSTVGVVKRDGGEIQASASVQAMPWLEIEGGYGIRRFASLAGSQDWTTPRVGVRLSTQLGTAALRAYTRLAYSPGVSVSGQPSVSLGLLNEVGVNAVLGGAFSARLSYRLERYDFSGGSGARVEQFDGISLRVGMSLPRLRGARSDAREP